MVGIKRSTDRVLTTHAGGLPQADAVRTAASAEQRAAALEQAVRQAVEQQVACGLDVVSDGEQSKSSFTTYAAERLGGLEERAGAPPSAAVSDRQKLDFPDYFAAHARPPRTRMYCVGPITYTGQAQLTQDLQHLQQAVTTVSVAEAMAVEYRAIVDAGFVLQIDNPDLANGYGLYTDLSPAEFHRFEEPRIEALNHALRGIPADRVRMRVRWGAYSVEAATSTSGRSGKTCGCRRTSCSSPG